MGTLVTIRQQMDEKNHDMVNMFIQQIGAVITPLMENTNNVCAALAQQMVLLNQALGIQGTGNNNQEHQQEAEVEMPANQADGQGQQNNHDQPNLNGQNGNRD